MAEVEMDPFEARFEARLRAYAAVPYTPADADAVAHAAASSRRSGLAHWPLLGIRVPALVWLALALLLAIAGGILAGALLQLVHPQPPAPLVIATETGLYLGDADGGSLRALREDGSFLLPRWSPRGDRIAVLHGPPIPAQIGAEGGLPRTPVEFNLVVSEALILDDHGSTLGRYPAGATDLAWSPAGDDGASLLAVRLTSGDVVVLDDLGRVVADLGLDDPVDAAGANTFLPSGLAWASPTVLVAATGNRLVRFDAAAPDSAPPFVALADGRINGVAVSPNGALAAFMVAGCRLDCEGELRVIRVPPYAPSSDPAPNTGRAMATGIAATTAPSWIDDRWVLTWPTLTDYNGGRARPLAIGRIEALDVVAPAARPAADGSGRMIVLAQYPYFNDRHFDAWLLDPDGTPHRLARRTLGFDLRPTGGSATDGTNGASHRP